MIVNENIRQKPILVTGATGYIGGRLVPLLIEKGFRVRAMARSMVKLRGRSWSDHPNIELVQADMFDPDTLDEATHDCFAAYYLIHSMNTEQAEFVSADRLAAQNFLRSSEKNGLERIIYLGGLGWDQPNASSHLKSRHEVGSILQSGSVSVTRFRAAHILGSGSACFEIIRYLFERLPFYVIPRTFIETKVQPISVRNVLTYLVECLDKEATKDQSFEIGGPDVLTYRELFNICAEEKGLKKPIFIDTPKFELGKKLALLIVRWLLPLPSSISQPLFEGLAVQVVLKDYRISQFIPQELITCREAIRKAFEADTLHLVQSRWTDAGELKPPEWLTEGDAPYSGGTIFQIGHSAYLNRTPERVWPMIRQIGGEQGWYSADLLWHLRGWIDRLVGGFGLWRGRRHPSELRAGEVLDFWRVLKISPPHKLILLSEKKQPGDAVLIFELIPEGEQTKLSILYQFRPWNLAGIFYWYSFLAFRSLMFRGMIREISKITDRDMNSGPDTLDIL